MEQVLFSLPLSKIEPLFKKWLKDAIAELDPINESNEDLIDRKEAKKLLGISDPTLWRWEKEGKIQGYSIGGKRYFKKNELLNSPKSLNL